MELLLKIISHWDSALAVLIVLGGLIFFHELGHFSMARWLGIGVRTFSLGFGPRIWVKRANQTDYCLSLIPLGGYVELAGEEEVMASEAEAETTPQFPESELFSSRPAWQRLLVVLAGPVANFILAFVIYTGLAATMGQTYLVPELGEIKADSPAAVAGLQSGDVVLNLNGKPVETWLEVASGIGERNGAPVDLTIVRDNTELQLSITPESSTRTNIFGEVQQAWLIGIRASGQTATKDLGPIAAIGAGFNECVGMISFTMESIAKLFQNIVPLDNVGGPIMIAQIVGEQAQKSLSAVLLLAALISINLGILNLLPIPVLDGGHIVFYIVEIIAGRPINATVRQVATRIGMFLLIGLMLFATWNDLSRIIAG